VRRSRILWVVLIGVLAMAAYSFFSSGGDDAHAAETGVLPKPKLELASDKDAKPGEKKPAEKKPPEKKPTK